MDRRVTKLISAISLIALIVVITLIIAFPSNQGGSNGTIVPISQQSVEVYYTTGHSIKTFKVSMDSSGTPVASNSSTLFSANVLPINGCMTMGRYNGDLVLFYISLAKRHGEAWTLIGTRSLPWKTYAYLAYYNLTTGEKGVIKDLTPLVPEKIPNSFCSCFFDEESSSLLITLKIIFRNSPGPGYEDPALTGEYVMQYNLNSNTVINAFSELNYSLEYGSHTANPLNTLYVNNNQFFIVGNNSPSLYVNEFEYGVRELVVTASDILGEPAVFKAISPGNIVGNRDITVLAVVAPPPSNVPSPTLKIYNLTLSSNGQFLSASFLREITINNLSPFSFYFFANDSSTLYRVINNPAESEFHIEAYNVDSGVLENTYTVDPSYFGGQVDNSQAISQVLNFKYTDVNENKEYFGLSFRPDDILNSRFFTIEKETSSSGFNSINEHQLTGESLYFPVIDIDYLESDNSSSPVLAGFQSIRTKNLYNDDESVIYSTKLNLYDLENQTISTVREWQGNNYPTVPKTRLPFSSVKNKLYWLEASSVSSGALNFFEYNIDSGIISQQDWVQDQLNINWCDFIPHPHPFCSASPMNLPLTPFGSGHLLLNNQDEVTSFLFYTRGSASKVLAVIREDQPEPNAHDLYEGGSTSYFPEDYLDSLAFYAVVDRFSDEVLGYTLLHPYMGGLYSYSIPPNNSTTMSKGFAIPIHEGYDIKHISDPFSLNGEVYTVLYGGPDSEGVGHFYLFNVTTHNIAPIEGIQETDSVIDFAVSNKASFVVVEGEPSSSSTTSSTSSSVSSSSTSSSSSQNSSTSSISESSTSQSESTSSSSNTTSSSTSTTSSTTSSSTSTSTSSSTSSSFSTSTSEFSSSSSSEDSGDDDNTSSSEEISSSSEPSSSTSSDDNPDTGDSSSSVESSSSSSEQSSSSSEVSNSSSSEGSDQNNNNIAPPDEPPSPPAPEPLLCKGKNEKKAKKREKLCRKCLRKAKKGRGKIKKKELRKLCQQECKKCKVGKILQLLKNKNKDGKGRRRKGDKGEGKRRHNRR